MSFDVAIGTDDNGLTQVLGALYNRPTLRARIFSGSDTIDAMGVKGTVSFALEAPPLVKLSAPTADQWKKAIKQDGNTALPAANAMIVTLPKLKLTRPAGNGGAPTSGDVSLDAIVTVNIVDNALSYDALAVVIDLSGATPLDQMIYKKIVIPRALAAVDKAFGHPHIPNIGFRGLKFGAIAFMVGEGRIVGVANLADKPPPGPQQLSSFPNEPFFILLSREAMQITCQSGVGELVGKTAGKDGSENFGVGRASYHGSVRLDAISVAVANNPTVVNASVAISASASAGVDVLGQIIGGITDVANKIADGGKDAVNKVGDGIKDVGNKIADTFHSY